MKPDHRLISAESPTIISPLPRSSNGGEGKVRGSLSVPNISANGFAPYDACTADKRMCERIDPLTLSPVAAGERGIGCAYGYVHSITASSREGLLTLHFPVAFVPLGIGHAFAFLLAFGGRGAPEPQLVEIAIAVGLAARIGQELIALAGRWNRRNRPEPRRDIALELGLERVIEPQIGAIGMRRLGMHHRRVGPARRPFFGYDGSNRFLVALKQVHLIRP